MAQKTAAWGRLFVGPLSERLDYLRMIGVKHPDRSAYGPAMGTMGGDIPVKTWTSRAAMFQACKMSGYRPDSPGLSGERGKWNPIIPPTPEESRTVAWYCR